MRTSEVRDTLVPFNSSKPSGYFNVTSGLLLVKFYFLPKEYICVIAMDLGTSSNYFRIHNQLIIFIN
jgi:hypothetical protein